LRERDPDQENVLNLKFKVKEKATGQLQASLAASPESGKSFNIFGQGSYDEKNQSGRGWGLNLTGKWDGGENYSLSTQFVNPRVNDSQWSLALSLSYRQQETLFSGLEFTEIREGAGITVGRKIIELIRGSIGYSITRSYQKEGDFIFDRFRPDGIKSEMTLGLSRRDLDNYIDPTDGSSLSLEHGFVGGPILGGDFQFMESTLDTRYYFPVDFTDTFRTHFRLQGVLGHLWSYGGKEIPFTERYRLGGDFDLRGYGPQEISPRFSILRSPTDSADTYPKGGDKQIYFQLEYFVPLIPEAGIKGLVFADAGRVFDMGESLSMQGFAKDVGFGIRWLTPLAPFRIEWAFPINEDGSLGRMRPIFSIGFER
jgi:outer membrane protein insertion porin family